MLKKYILFFFITFFCRQTLFAQIENRNFFPTPNAASLGIYGQIPVDPFNGLPQISIPLYEFKSGSITLPISLSYHGGGIKPSERASWVGLGWSLQSGGVITRIMNDLPDEYINYLQFSNDYLGKPPSQYQTILNNNKNGFFYKYSELADDNWLTTTLAKEFSILGTPVISDLDAFFRRKDKAPDEFQFNFMGMSGSLFMDNQGQWQVKSKQNINFQVEVQIGPYLLIEKTTSNSGSVIKNCLNKIILTSNDGTKYYFGSDSVNNPNITNIYGPNSNNNNTTTNWGPGRKNFDLTADSAATEFSRIGKGSGTAMLLRDGGTIPVSWYLTKIKTITGDSVLFKYARDGYQIVNSPTRSAYTYKAPSNVTWRPTKYFFPETGYDMLSILDGISLIQIIGKNGYVDFKKSKANTLDFNLINSIYSKHFNATGFFDLFNAYGHELFNSSILDFSSIYNLKSNYTKLDTINIFDYLNNPVKSINFSYSENSNNRLFLNSFNTLSSNKKLSLPSTKFEYNNKDLLDRIPYETNKIDHWGYYNGKDPFSGINVLFAENVSFLPNYFNKSFSNQYYFNRLPNIDSLKLGILTAIHFPTGGSTEFIWESNLVTKFLTHNVSRNNYILNIVDSGVNQVGAGLRIKKIISRDGISTKPLIKSYAYDRDFINNKNGLTSGILNGKFPNYVDHFVIGSNFEYFKWSSFDQTPMHYTNGAVVNYSKVQELNDDGSIVEYQYSNHDNGYLDKPSKATIGYIYSNLNKFEYKVSSLELERGLLLSESKYNNKNLLVQKKILEYNNESNRLNKSIRKYVFESRFSVTGVILCPSCDTYINPGPPAIMGNNIYALETFYHHPYLKSESISQYDQSGANPVVSTNNYTYDAFRNIKISNYSNSSNESVIKMYNYPNDILTTGNISIKNSMISAGMNGVPIEVITYKNSNEISRNKTDYKIFNQGQILPSVYLESFSGKTLEPRKLYNFYDDNGNILEEQKPNDVKVNYLWGYNKSYPIAKIVGSDNISINNVISNNKIDLTNSNDKNISILLNSLQKSLPKAQISTYTYKPLVGMTSETNPRGKTVFYNYDGFNRLTAIRDHDGNILKKFCYNYSGEPINCEGIKYYFNLLSIKKFKKENCQAGSYTDSVTYTVTAGKYVSTISQADADAKALEDVNLNGQKFANTNGVCTFYSFTKSGTFTKTNCAIGGTPSSVIYTVTARAYNSIISQADADLKAQADVNANGQNYANANGTCTFYSTVKSGTFTKTNCEIGGNPSSVLYTVAANAYSSTISQADADAKAQNDLNTNGQNYANINGVCTFYNNSKSGTFTKNNCAIGGTPSIVTYIVAANAYTSIISQADADAKAQADVNANGQSYANANGSCTFNSVAISGTFTKTDCSRGTPSVLTYTVASNAYTSTISQADADAKAQNDLNINGQNYANVNGTCLLPYTISNKGALNFEIISSAFYATGPNTNQFTITGVTTVAMATQYIIGTITPCEGFPINGASISVIDGSNRSWTLYISNKGLVTATPSNPFYIGQYNTITFTGTYSGPFGCYVYYSLAKSGTFTKNDCTTGATPSSVTYTVAANAYNSTISQADADAKAQADVNANGQSYANANGTCTFNSVAISGTFTKTDCSRGTPSVLTYTVASNAYTSTISQADADAKAQNDVNINGQNYANANGYCLLPYTVSNTGALNFTTSTSAFYATDANTNQFSITGVTSVANASQYVLGTITPCEGFPINGASVSVIDGSNRSWRLYISDKGLVTATPSNPFYIGQYNTITFTGTYSGPFGCYVYYSLAKSGTFTKNDCTTGATPSSVTYTVAANAYNSTISQADADAKAHADVNANGQSYANANGTCTFNNISKSGTFTKNDCTTGGTPSSVIYTVAANTYFSIISQADADAKAQADINANGQNYVNANGTCTFYSVAKSGVFTKNNCSFGGTPSNASYTVAANSYSSLISQADADAKAQNDVNANGQSYANANGTCTYYNASQSRTFTKNNCISGGTPNSVNYTVSARTYNSIISQEDANSKALNDVNTNGQNYANANGTCTFYSVSISGTFTKNNCSRGTPSTVTYSVPTSTYNSIISQADADAKAQADVTANGQIYANANGTCILPYTISNVGTSNFAFNSASFYATSANTNQFSITGVTTVAGASQYVLGTITPCEGFPVNQASFSVVDPSNRTWNLNINNQGLISASPSVPSSIGQYNTINFTGTYSGPFGCYVFYSTAKSGTFTKNNCSVGTPSSVTYTVAANAYNSTISQADADAKAQADVNANGQNYANSNGTCTVVCACEVTPNIRCVNNFCEEGIQVFTRSVLNKNGTYTCTYHYEWSDGFVSPNYILSSESPCDLYR